MTAPLSRSLPVILVLVLPWALYFVSLITLAILIDTLELAPSFDPGYGGLVAWWTFLALAVDAILLGKAREGLRRWFQDLANGAQAASRRTATPRPREGSTGAGFPDQGR